MAPLPPILNQNLSVHGGAYGGWQCETGSAGRYFQIPVLWYSYKLPPALSQNPKGFSTNRGNFSDRIACSFPKYANPEHQRKP